MPCFNDIQCEVCGINKQPVDFKINIKILQMES